MTLAGKDQANPFRYDGPRLDGLRELKRAIVKLGNSGDRKALRLARQLFDDVPGLKQA